MSILNKPYKISIWNDIWDDQTLKFKEEFLCVIGANNMTSQSRALEPNLVRNVNGTKTFSFQMYRYYIDNETGEKVENVFIKELVSERKVKLEYDGQWYDFIIKDIAENSSNYLYTYRLEDALVQELSRNGFGITLNTQLMNNMGTADQLASQVLAETDWTVGSSEHFVEQVEESLVYLSFPAKTLNKVYLVDDTDIKEGLSANEITITSDEEDIRVLAFYSSCTNKPHRFQFIYPVNGLTTDTNRVVQNKLHQYYIEYTPDEYVDDESAFAYEKYGFNLPQDWNVWENTEGSLSSSSAISALYRGKRYGYAQQQKFIPMLDRYVSVYKKNGQDYLGYMTYKYTSPLFMQNYATNTSFETTGGWIGTYLGETPENRTTVEVVHGRFEGKKFITSLSELGTPKFEDNLNKGAYKGYLKVTYGDNGILLNSGPYDNRTMLAPKSNTDNEQGMTEGSEWYLKVTALDSEGAPVELDCQIKEYDYNKSTFGYMLVNENAITFDSTDVPNVYKVATSQYTEKTFKDDSKIRIAIFGDDNSTYYIQNLEFFPYILKENGQQMFPISTDDTEENDGTEEETNINEGITKEEYRYFPASQFFSIDEGNWVYAPSIATEKELKYESSANPDYNLYQPVYNDTGDKVRSVTAAESNYFNILQSIAETFGCWLNLSIARDSYGGIIEKKVEFKNDSGAQNHACFRYGVNLVDIQRTYASKNIVTKLIVKSNSNQHGKDGFCTIQRAGSNPTGENYIYDFQYFQNQGLINAEQFLETLYSLDGAVGKDIDVSHTRYTLNGYFPRIKNINTQYQNLSTQKNNLSLELSKINANLVVAENLKTAANSTLEEVTEDFLKLTGVLPTQANLPVIDIQFDGSTNHWDYTSWLNMPSIQLSNGNIVFSVTPIESSPYDRTAQIWYDLKLISEKTSKETRCTVIYTFPKDSIAPVSYSIPAVIVDLENNDVQKYLNEYLECISQINSAEKDIQTYEPLQTEKEAQNNILTEELNALLEYKTELNKLFFTTYSNFIQEGTWISEEYMDDEKYYIDAQSTLYTSCYPQVAYTINVRSLSGLPEYTDFVFNLGETTYVIDSEFFGTTDREKVGITELSNYLDDPSRDQIKVQNYKTQFQDLFQKITATVQQAQYSSGAYEKAASLETASVDRKRAFLEDAFNNTESLFKVGESDVIQDANGITVTNKNTGNQVRLTGGAILISGTDEKTKERKWKMGISYKGISAELLTAGILNAGKIQIMNKDQPLFRWDEHGISAYAAATFNGVTSNINTSKFVRFDRNGIYGIDGSADGASWYPENLDEINSKATFALTWDGLKVTGNNDTTAFIGKKGSNVILITKGQETLLSFDTDGTLKIGDWSVTNKGLEVKSETAVYFARRAIETPQEPNDGKTFLNAKPTVYSLKDWNTYDGEDLEELEAVPIVFKAGERFMVSEYGDAYFRNAQFNKGVAKGLKIIDGDINVNNQFIVDGATGDVTFSGNVTWSQSNQNNFQVYAETDIVRPTDGRKDFEPSDDEDWHTTFNPEKDKWACYTTNGGLLWTGPMRIVGEDGEDGDSSEIELQECFYAWDIVKSGMSIDFEATQREKGLSEIWKPIDLNGQATSRPEEKFVTEISADQKQIRFSIANNKDGESIWSGWFEIENITNFRVFTIIRYTRTGNVQSVEYSESIMAASYSRELLINMLNNAESRDGIYQDNGYIAINATAIKTGYLHVGGTSTDGSDALFYANIKDPIVKIAGWNVTSTGLYSGLTNNVPTIYLGSSGITAPIDGTDREELVFKAGTKFGVTADGTLYCISGNFSGNITGGTIGIGGTSSNPKFKVDQNGNVTMTGNINLTGNITWGNSGITGALPKDSSNGDGIYYADGKIQLNASAINTGELLIGNTDNELFYANKSSKDPQVRVAGWEIAKDSIHKGSTFLYSFDQTEDRYINNHKSNTWRFTSGQNFGVDSVGNVYANSGKFGNWGLSRDGLIYEDTNRFQEIGVLTSYDALDSTVLNTTGSEAIYAAYTHTSNLITEPIRLIFMLIGDVESGAIYTRLPDGAYDIWGTVCHELLEESKITINYCTDQFLTQPDVVTTTEFSEWENKGNNTYSYTLTDGDKNEMFKVSLSFENGYITVTFNLLDRFLDIYRVEVDILGVGEVYHNSYISRGGQLSSNDFVLRSGTTQLRPYTLTINNSSVDGFIIEDCRTGKCKFLSINGLEDPKI